MRGEITIGLSVVEGLGHSNKTKVFVLKNCFPGLPRLFRLGHTLCFASSFEGLGLVNQIIRIIDAGSWCHSLQKRGWDIRAY
jgi:hypothetical protein